MNVSACAVCDASLLDARVIFRSTRSFNDTPCDSRLVECPQCSHVMLNPRPSPEELDAYYSGEYHCYVDGEAPSANSSTQEFHHLPVIPGGRYLDIGCGVGNLVAGMSQRGMLAEGVEPSMAAAQKAAQMGRKVHGCTLQEALFPDDHFDCMSMSHVLEHVEDIKGLLAECVRVLKPGGYFMIGVPNFDSAVFKRVGEFWIGLQLPTHLHHFRMGSLKRLVLDAGLSIERAFSESLVPHVEGELVCHIRRRYKIPARILLRIHLIRPYAARVAAEAESSGRGEALVFRMRKAA